MRGGGMFFGYAVLLGSAFVSNAQAAQNAAEVTFYKDALPVFQQKCQTCHRTGQVAPFSLETYETARPWARAIKSAVVSKVMPPGQGFSGEHFSKQIARSTLTNAEAKTIVSWVDGGAPRGDPKDAPPPVAFNKDGWHIRPDIVIESPIEYEVPAEGVMPWVDYLLPYKFEKDTYVAATELIPSNRALVHHYTLFIIPPGPFAASLEQWDVTKPLPNPMLRKGLPATAQLLDGAGGGPLGDWTPGKTDDRFDGDDSGILVPAGSRLSINLHYNANGKAGQDRARLGLEVLPEKPKNAFRYLFDLGGPAPNTIIPPGAPDFTGEVHMVLKHHVTVVAIHPHMHVRGKDWKYTVTYPDGRQEVLLNVPNYNYQWQFVYVPDTPIKLPAGTRIDIVGRWDNSAGNKSNPDPTVPVVMGNNNGRKCGTLS